MIPMDRKDILKPVAKKLGQEEDSGYVDNIYLQRIKDRGVKRREGRVRLLAGRI